MIHHLCKCDPPSLYMWSTISLSIYIHPYTHITRGHKKKKKGREEGQSAVFPFGWRGCAFGQWLHGGVCVCSDRCLCMCVLLISRWWLCVCVCGVAVHSGSVGSLSFVTIVRWVFVCSCVHVCVLSCVFCSVSSIMCMCAGTTCLSNDLRACRHSSVCVLCSSMCARFIDVCVCVCHYFITSMSVCVCSVHWRCVCVWSSSFV